MRLRLLLDLASRQLASRSHSGVVRTVSVLSVSGIAIGVASLLLLQAFMSGFQDSISSFLSAANAPLLAYAPGSELLDGGDADLIAGVAASIPGAGGISPFIEKAAVASGNNGEIAGVIVRGVDWESEYAVTGLGGILGPPPGGAVLGKDLAARLAVSEGDSVRLASSESATITAAGRALVDTIISVPVARVCDFGLEEYNSGLVLTERGLAEALFDLRGRYTAVGIGLEPGADGLSVAARMAGELRDEFVEARHDRFMLCEAFLTRHENLFRAFGLERLAMSIVLGLITVVALLNLSSALSMIAMEHRRDLGVLRAMGASPMSVIGIALTQGSLLAVCGCGAGMAFALVVQALADTILPIRLESSVYWIDVLPARLDPGFAAAVAAFTVMACLLASLFPALRSLSVPPAECVRNE